MTRAHDKLRSTARWKLLSQFSSLALDSHGLASVNLDIIQMGFIFELLRVGQCSL